MPKENFSQKFDHLGEDIEGQDETFEQLKSGQEKDDDTRQAVARTFVSFYFWILILVIVGIPIYNLAAIELTGNSELILPLKDIALTYSAVVGPTIGLVIAYYFESRKSD